MPERFARVYASGGDIFGQNKHTRLVCQTMIVEGLAQAKGGSAPSALGAEC